MNYKSVIFFLYLFITGASYAMEFQEDQQLRGAILKLDVNAVDNLLDQRDHLLSEEEYNHYLHTLSQTPDYGHTEWLNYTWRIIGPVTSGLFFVGGYIGDQIIDNWHVVSSASPIITMAKNGVWRAIKYGSRVCFALSGLAGAGTIASYFACRYCSHKIQQSAAIGAILQRNRAINRIPVDQRR